MRSGVHVVGRCCYGTGGGIGVSTVIAGFGL